jgi:hypothetical protein
MVTTPPASRAHRGGRRAAALLAAFLLSGCASGPHPAARAPENARPGALSLNVSNFVDTDENGYLDTSTVMVFIFAETLQYQLPLRLAGEFDFTLEGPGGKTLAAWTFNRAQAAAALRDLGPGPGYVFELSLPDGGGGTDRLGATEAELACTFRPAEGPPLKARTKSPLTLGRIGAHPARP